MMNIIYRYVFVVLLVSLIIDIEASSRLTPRTSNTFNTAHREAKIGGWYTLFQCILANRFESIHLVNSSFPINRCIVGELNIVNKWKIQRLQSVVCVKDSVQIFWAACRCPCYVLRCCCLNLCPRPRLAFNFSHTPSTVCEKKTNQQQQKP